MPEKLNLATPLVRNFFPGVSKTVSSLDLVDFHLHREAVFNQSTGVRSGWLDAAAYVEVVVVGDFGVTETIRVLEGTAAATAMTQLNNANLTTKGLHERLMELVRDYIKDGQTPYAGTLV